MTADVDDNHCRARVTLELPSVSNDGISSFCSTHGIDAARSRLHSQCKECLSGATSALNFVRQAQDKHGERFSYDKAIWYNKDTKIDNIVCLQHPDRTISIHKVNHLKDSRVKSRLPFAGCLGCQVAAQDAEVAERGAKFLREATSIWGKDRYDFSSAKYSDIDSKVEVKCLVHDIVYLITPKVILKRGTRYLCQKCANAARSRAKTSPKEKFIEKCCKNNPNFIEDLELIDDPSMFPGDRTKIKIRCRRCNVERERSRADIKTKPYCQRCDTSGFDLYKPTILYHVAIKVPKDVATHLRLDVQSDIENNRATGPSSVCENNDGSVLIWKIGISNVAVRERLRKDIGKIVWGEVWLFDSGLTAKKAEDLAKNLTLSWCVTEMDALRSFLNGGGEEDVRTRPVIATSLINSKGSSDDNDKVSALRDYLNSATRRVIVSNDVLTESQYNLTIESNCACFAPLEEVLGLMPCTDSALRSRGKAITVGGHRWNSRAACAADLKFESSYISNLASNDSTSILETRVKEFIARKRGGQS